ALGGYLAVRSPLGYSLVGGARYYGIGNEFMGILLGAAVVALGGMLQRFHVSRRPATLMMAAGLAGLVVVLGASRMGANFGGALAAAVTAVTAVTALQEEPLRLGSRVILPAGAAAALTAAVVMTADLLGGGGLDPPLGHHPPQGSRHPAAHALDHLEPGLPGHPGGHGAGGRPAGGHVPPAGQAVPLFGGGLRRLGGGQRRRPDLQRQRHRGGGHHLAYSRIAAVVHGFIRSLGAGFPG